jgi:small-conductance mechanosensitive channel
MLDLFGHGTLRWALSIVLLLIAFWGSKGLQHYFGGSDATQDAGARRATFVASRNLLWGLTLLLLFFLWIGQLKHFALSVAALAAALLIVTKEITSCILGSLIRTAVRSFQLGDSIEIGTISGKVIDTNVFTTTLLETDTARQFTGNTVEFPNALLLTLSVKNLSHTGKYLIESLRVPIGTDAQVSRQAAKLLSCTNSICQNYLEEAVEHLSKMERDRVLDLPNFRPRVLIEPKDAKQVDLVVRFPVPQDSRNRTVQAILSCFYREDPPAAQKNDGQDKVPPVS